MTCQKSQSFPGAEHALIRENPKLPPKAIANLQPKNNVTYSFVIPLFPLIFHADLISVVLFKFSVFIYFVKNIHSELIR